jgi:hypothetical protein
LIDWCFTSTLAIFQLYRGVNKCYYYTYTAIQTLTLQIYIRNTKYWLPSLLHPLTSLVAPLLQYPHPHLHERVRKLYYISSSYISLWFSSANGVIHTLSQHVYHTNLKGTGHQIIKHLFQINITYKLCVWTLQYLIILVKRDNSVCKHW